MIWVFRSLGFTMVALTFIHIPKVCAQSNSPNSTVLLSDIDKSLSSISDRIEQFLKNDMIYSSSETQSSENKSLKKHSIKVVSQSVPTKVQKKSPSDSYVRSPSTGLGFYILPFAGLQSSNYLKFNTVLGGELDIDEKIGFNTGVRIGYNFKNLFTDLQLSHFRNSFKENSGSFLVNGESTGAGIHISFGGRFDLNHYSSFYLGGGVGGVDHDVSLHLLGNYVSDTNFAFSSQLFTGFEFRPSEYVVLGARYRWSRLEGTGLFSAKQLHLLDFSLGHIF